MRSDEHRFFFSAKFSRLTITMATANITQRLQNTVAEGNFYEAQQIYKTLYFRYCTSKKLHEARELLISGALTMLQHKQTTCATELSRMLLNLYNEEHTKCTQESLGNHNF